MLKLIIQILASLLLVSCDMTSGDVKKFVENTKKSQISSIEPLSHLKEYTQISYEAIKFREPFSLPVNNSPYKMPTTRKGVIKQQRRPDYDRPKEYLEGMPLDSLIMVGTLEKRGEMWALIVDRTGIIHRVKEGNFLGENSGKITKITEKQVFIEETVPDGEGGWVGRKADMGIKTKQ